MHCLTTDLTSTLPAATSTSEHLQERAKAAPEDCTKVELLLCIAQVNTAKVPQKLKRQEKCVVKSSRRGRLGQCVAGA